MGEFFLHFYKIFFITVLVVIAYLGASPYQWCMRQVESFNYLPSIDSFVDNMTNRELAHSIEELAVDNTHQYCAQNSSWKKTYGKVLEKFFG